MFGYVVLAGVAIVGAFALNEARKPTGQKARNGDNVFVDSKGLRVAILNQNQDVTFDNAMLASFIQGTVAASVKITDIVINNGMGRGTLLGFSRGVVEFPITSIIAIERNGAHIT